MKGKIAWAFQNKWHSGGSGAISGGCDEEEDVVGVVMDRGWDEFQWRSGGTNQC